MHKIIKVFYVVLRNLIKVVDGFSPRRYMKLYNWYLKKIGVDLYGYPRFIHPTVYFDGKGYKNTHIGENVVLSKNVLILNHDYSITCGLRSIGKKVVDNEAYWLRDIYIGNNVFVGANVSILPGTTIGDNCIYAPYLMSRKINRSPYRTIDSLHNCIRNSNQNKNCKQALQH